MPLTEPVARELIHKRRIECNAYRRSDQLWDIEGHLVDTKTYGFDNEHRGRVEAGEPIHEMWLRLTIDEDFLIHESEAVSDHFPFRACPQVTPNFAALKGLHIGVGWRRKVHELLGGVKGCTHLVELLGPLGTTAFQAVFSNRNRRAPAVEAAPRKPRLLNSCYSLRSDGEVAKKSWPDYYTGT